MLAKKLIVKAASNAVKLVGGYVCHTAFPVVQCGGGSSYKSQLTLRFVALIYPLLLLHLFISSVWGCPAGRTRGRQLKHFLCQEVNTDHTEEH